MLIVLPLTLALVGAIALRHADGPGGRRPLLVVAALAFGVRLLASGFIYLIARPVHVEGVWLNDEASFFLATESLLPNPLDRALPVGLDHLGGDGYLGLTTAISMVIGGADSNAFRVVNAGLGAIVVVLSMLAARRMLGARAGLVTGLILAVYPPLVLWSATMLRDTLGSFAVVTVWWTLGRARDAGPVRLLGTIFLALVLLLGLRPYLGGAVAVGVVAVAAYAMLKRLPARHLAVLGAAAAALGVVVLISQARRLDFAAHELLYRQTVTRLETLGRLYTDTPPETSDLPMRPGAAVAIVVDPHSGWLLTGVIQDVPQDDVVRVAFTDESIREVPISDVVLVQSARIPPLQLLAIVPNLASFISGASTTNESNSPAWMLSALAWDLIAILAVVACARERIGAREWLLPLCVTAGTALALVAIPGAPGNADRHRTTQTLPLLLVLASGLVASRPWSARAEGLAVTNISTSPASEPTPTISRMRSAR